MYNIFKNWLYYILIPIMNILMINIILSFFILKFSVAYIIPIFNNIPIKSLGVYNLRKSNNSRFDKIITILELNDNNIIKLKTINLDGIFAIKISRKGELVFNNNILNFIKKDYYIKIVFNNINKYTYSFFGIEYPEIKYNQIDDYFLLKNIRFKYNDNTIIIFDDKYYYIFDLINNFNNKLPYVESPFTNVLFIQILGFIINLLLVKLFFGNN